MVYGQNIEAQLGGDHRQDNLKGRREPHKILGQILLQLFLQETKILGSNSELYALMKSNWHF
jgi:hypothetical protein